ncbi:MAG: hypothetical protein U1F53_23965 [Burkholderiaceae bacterium]
MRKFNGWQRLWVVVTALALPFTMYVWHHYFGEDFPTEAGVRKNAQTRADDLVRISVDHDQFMRCMRSRADTPEEVVAKWNEHGEYCRDKLGGKPGSEAVRASADTMAKAEAYIGGGLRVDQTKALLVPLAAWIIISLFAYIAGTTTAWVIRGFRSQKSGV